MSITPFIIFAVAAYGLQLVFGLFQIRHFNETYKALRQQGKVAIGRRPGKIKSGTLVLFAIEESGKILDTRIMQGVTVLSKFKQLDQFTGHDLHYIDKYHPLVRKENKLTQEAMENARELFLKVTTGNYIDEPPKSPFQQFGTTLSVQANMLKNKIKGSVS